MRKKSNFIHRTNFTLFNICIWKRRISANNDIIGTIRKTDNKLNTSFNLDDRKTIFINTLIRLK